MVTGKGGCGCGKTSFRCARFRVSQRNGTRRRLVIQRAQATAQSVPCLAAEALAAGCPRSGPHPDADPHITRIVARKRRSVGAARHPAREDGPRRRRQFQDSRNLRQITRHPCATGRRSAANKTGVKTQHLRPGAGLHQATRMIVPSIRLAKSSTRALARRRVARPRSPRKWPALDRPHFQRARRSRPRSVPTCRAPDRNPHRTRSA